MYQPTLYQDRDEPYADAEQRLHNASFGLYPEYYALTHTVTFIREYPSYAITIHVDSPDFAQYLSTITAENQINIKTQAISLTWIKEELQQSPLIVYIDAFYLEGGRVHVPHFVYLYLGADEQNLIADPAVGQARVIADKELEDGILGLKYHMLWSPIALTMQQAE